MSYKYFSDRLKEYSTWYGIVQVICAFQLFNITDTQATAILALITSVFFSGTASIITPDKTSSSKEA